VQQITALASILGYEGVEGKTKYTEKEIEDLMNQLKTRWHSLYV
jgi:hypothetical protein